MWNCWPERYGKFQSEIPSTSGAICEKPQGGPFAPPPPAGRGLTFRLCIFCPVSFSLMHFLLVIFPPMHCMHFSFIYFFVLIFVHVMGVFVSVSFVPDLIHLMLHTRTGANIRRLAYRLASAQLRAGSATLAARNLGSVLVRGLSPDWVSGLGSSDDLKPGSTRLGSARFRLDLARDSAIESRHIARIVTSLQGW